MKKVVFPLYLLLLASHLLFANNDDKTNMANKTNMASGRLTALPSKNADLSDDSGTGLRKQSTAPAPMLVAPCDLNTYQSAVIIAPADFPYTSGSGITVSATSNTGTLTNANYTCGQTHSLLPRLRGGYSLPTKQLHLLFQRPLPVLRWL